MSSESNLRFRLMGLLPLAFFLIQLIHYWRYGGLGNLMWMCNLGNVLLGIGLLLGHRELIRAAAIWTIPGLFVWIRYVLLASGFYLATTFAHLGGITIGLIALRRVRMDRLAWVYAFAWYLLAQVAARELTSRDLNVNVAHVVQSGWESTFSSYWKFWVVMTTAVALVLWIIGKVLSLIWPAKSISESGVASEGR